MTDIDRAEGMEVMDVSDGPYGWRGKYVTGPLVCGDFLCESEEEAYKLHQWANIGFFFAIYGDGQAETPQHEELRYESFEEGYARATATQSARAEVLEKAVKACGKALKEAESIFDGEMGDDWADQYGFMFEALYDAKNALRDLDPPSPTEPGKKG